MTKTLYGDNIVRLRRTEPVNLAAEIQWSRFPPLTYGSSEVTIAAGLGPAYRVAGDSIDYAVEAGIARLAVFDGMVTDWPAPSWSTSSSTPTDTTSASGGRFPRPFVKWTRPSARSSLGRRSAPACSRS